jgi:hypothetical protein
MTTGLPAWEAETAGVSSFSNFGAPDACGGSLGQPRGDGEEGGVPKEGK